MKRGTILRKQVKAMDSTVQTIKRITAVVTGILAGILGGFDSLLQFYTGLMVVDFALGCVKGIKAKNFSSAIALWGFINKIIALSVIVLCVLFDNVLGDGDYLRSISIIWFCVCEGASILENLAVIGIPFPQGLREVLVQAQKGFSINFSQIVGQIIKNYSPSDNGKEDNDHE